MNPLAHVGSSSSSVFIRKLIQPCWSLALAVAGRLIQKAARQSNHVGFLEDALLAVERGYKEDLLGAG